MLDMIDLPHPPFGLCHPNGQAITKGNSYSAAMSLARARILLIHSGPSLVTASYTALVVLAIFLAPIDNLTDIVIVAFVIAVAVAWSTSLVMRHLQTPCPRCDELRPAISARIEGIDDPRKWYEAYRRSHFARWVGVGIVAWSALAFVAVWVWLDGPDLQAGLAASGVIFAVGMWCLTISLSRHLQYHAHRCPWCRRIVERRIARNLMREVMRKRRESEIDIEHNQPPPDEKMAAARRCPECGRRNGHKMDCTMGRTKE